jgi:N-acetyl-gamma-glutamyl-phosphate reductase
MRSFVGCAEAEGSTAVFVGIDNLLKGGAGQGVQALNVLMGWEEDLGLPLVGAFP